MYVYSRNSHNIGLPQCGLQTDGHLLGILVRRPLPELVMIDAGVAFLRELDRVRTCADPLTCPHPFPFCFAIPVLEHQVQKLHEDYPRMATD